MAILTDADGPGGYALRCGLRHRWLRIRIPWELKEKSSPDSPPAPDLVPGTAGVVLRTGSAAVSKETGLGFQRRQEAEVRAPAIL